MKNNRSKNLIKKIQLFLIGVSCTVGYVFAENLPEHIQSALDKYNLPDSSISIYVEQIDNKDAVLDWRSDQLINPASTMKVITTYAGLDILGPDYTWNTNFYSESSVVDGIVDGKFYIKGYGDPLLINETLEEAVIAIRDKGIHTIADDLIIDNSYFDLGQSKLALYDDFSMSPYNALPDAANINFGTVEFNIITGKYSSRPNVVMNPQLPGYKMFSRMRLRGGKCGSSYLEPKIELVPHQGNMTVSFSGQYAKRCGNRSFYKVITTPDKLLFAAFKQLWQKHGGKLLGGYQYGVVPESAELIHSLVSEPLINQIAIMNKKSNNVMTRQLFLTLGAEKIGLPGTLDKSRQVIDSWLDKKGFTAENSFIDNGSGLSRKSVLSTKLLSDVLTDAAKHPQAQKFMESLAIAGVDGTMRNRFRNHPAQGRLFIKTGTLNGVRAIAGYVNSQSGNQYTVATIQQHPGIGNGRGQDIQNRILNWLYLR